MLLCYGTHQRMCFSRTRFSIVDYGAVKGGETVNTEAIAKAIAACNKAGGGRVVVPEGEWLTGPVHFKSNVNLHLEENAILRFTDNPSDYLPAVMTSWEGMECYNYSPLLYAMDCENIAITGKGHWLLSWILGKSGSNVLNLTWML